MGFIINSFWGGAPGGDPTSKIEVTFAEFDENDDCACTATGDTEIWEDDSMVMPSAGDLEPEVGDWINGQNENMESVCAQVTAVNETGDSVGYTENAYADCAACNDANYVCESGGPGGPGGP